MGFLSPKLLKGGVKFAEMYGVPQGAVGNLGAWRVVWEDGMAL